MRPYVGISGVTDPRQARAVAQQFRDAGFSPESAYQGLIGYCVTAASMAGAEPPAPRYADPDRLDVSLIPDLDIGANILHFVPPKNDDALCVKYLSQLLLETGLYEKKLCRMVQINYGTEYVTPHALHAIKQRMPDLEIVLQVGRRDLAERTTRDLLVQLAGYASFTSLFLIDPSQGRGVSFDAEGVRPVVSAIQSRFPTIPLGFAGGLTPGNLGEHFRGFSSLTAELFSIDVESGVRNEADSLCMEKTAGFISQAASLFLRDRPGRMVR